MSPRPTPPSALSPLQCSLKAYIITCWSSCQTTSILPLTFFQFSITSIISPPSVLQSDVIPDLRKLLHLPINVWGHHKIYFLRPSTFLLRFSFIQILNSFISRLLNFSSAVSAGGLTPSLSQSSSEAGVVMISIGSVQS